MLVVSFSELRHYISFHKTDNIGIIYATDLALSWLLYDTRVTVIIVWHLFQVHNLIMTLVLLVADLDKTKIRF